MPWKWKQKLNAESQQKEEREKEYIFLEGHGNRGVSRQTRSEKARAQLLKEEGEFEEGSGKEQRRPSNTREQTQAERNSASAKCKG